MKRPIKIGDRVTFAASPTSSTRYIGTVIEIGNGLARINVEGYGPNHISAVRANGLIHASEGLTPSEAWSGKC